MVRAPTVLVVVRPDLLRSRPAADLGLPLGRHLLLLLLQLHLEELGTQDLHGPLPVLELGPLLRAEDLDPAGLVREVHRRLHLVHVLPASAAAPRGGDLAVERGLSANACDGRTFHIRKPSARGTDWNDELQAWLRRKAMR